MLEDDIEKSCNHRLYCTNVCATCELHGYQKHQNILEPMEIEPKPEDDTNNKINTVSGKELFTVPKKNALFGGINISPAYQYPESWVCALQNGVNNLCFSQIVGLPDEPLYTVLGFFPNKLQCTINTKHVSMDSVQAFVHKDRIIITGKKLECFAMDNKGGCKELDVKRTIIIPIPMKHEQCQASIIENAHIYLLFVNWDISLP